MSGYGGRGLPLSLSNLLWLAISLAEALVAALSMGWIAFGPPPDPRDSALWLAGVAALALSYLAMSALTTAPLRSRTARARKPSALMPWLTSVPFLVGFLAALWLLSQRPGILPWLMRYISTIQPFPAVSMVLVVIAVALAKSLLVRSEPSLWESDSADGLRASADVMIPIAMLAFGVLQASVYIMPIGNAFLRFWGIADAIPLGEAYPVTVTEDGPVSAGSPPYVYDLALFPLMLLGSFSALGHNSLAGHFPGWFASALFPLSLYLLIREATGSRTTAVLFAAITSLFPYFRFWVLNLPDPDPLLLTSGCFAGYFFLRASNWPERSRRWIVAGLAAGVLSLARPEGILYAGFLGLAAVATRPRLKNLAAYLGIIAVFVLPMAAIWWTNFGFPWPQNYNKTLRLDYPLENYGILKNTDALSFYQRGLGLDGNWAAGFLALFVASVLFGAAAMALKDWRLLSMVAPGIGNTVLIFFANPYIPNTYHFADFFRHASFGIPFLVLASAYGFHQAYRWMMGRRILAPLAYGLLFFLVAIVAREGEIAANPTAVHKPGSTQVLIDYTHLSAEAIARNPMPLPRMTYRWNEDVNIVDPRGFAWPDDALSFFKPMDMSFDSRGRPYGYGSLAAVLLALLFALAAETPILYALRQGASNRYRSTNKR